MSVNDDSSIQDTENLWRRIHPDYKTPDGNGGYRPSSKAFQNASQDVHDKLMTPLGYTFDPGMSVDIASETTVEDVLQGYPGHYLAEFTVGYARSLGQGVVRAPLPKDAAHAVVLGNKKKAKKKFSKKFTWDSQYPFLAISEEPE